MQQLMIKNDRRMFSVSDVDSAMLKQIQATHSHDGGEVDVKLKLIFPVIEDILHRVVPSIDSATHGAHEHGDAFEDKSGVAGYDSVPEALASIINKISCELSCKCSGGADAHITTMAILNMLPSYSWDAKVVISLAAFAINYGEFWLIAHLCASNPLAKSLSILKQLPDIKEHAGSLKFCFDAVNDLVKAILNVNKCIGEFKEIIPRYSSSETLLMYSTAMVHIPIAVYWTIRSMVVCASQITSLLGMSYEHTNEARELSRYMVGTIHNRLKAQLDLCTQYLDEKRRAETYQALVRQFEITPKDNIWILNALISKDDKRPLLDGSTKETVSIDVLRKKTVLLLISDLDVSHEEITILVQNHHETRTRSDLDYKIVWLPIVEGSTAWNDVNEYQQKFEQLQSKMPWYVVHPSLLEPAVIKYIKEVWHFSKKPILVVLDPQGKLVSANALHMVMIWGNSAYPFTTVREESLWKQETWSLQLLVQVIHSAKLPIQDWIHKQEIICLYGGEDTEWIQKFTDKAKDVAQKASSTIEMVYVGKNKAKERVLKRITSKQLSHSWPDPISIWHFWTRLESMLYYKTHNKTPEKDMILQGVLTVLSFDGSDKGWAIISKGSAEMARADGDTLLRSFDEFDTWKNAAVEKGFVPALTDKLSQLHTPQHCYRLIIPMINVGTPEKIVCAECGRPMEQYLMYRCCTDFNDA